MPAAWPSRRSEDITDTARCFQRSESAEHLFVFRRADLGLSYAEMVHPSDFVSAYTAPRMSPSTRSFFPERLEKGVIRRGRICGWLLPSENDLTLSRRSWPGNLSMSRCR